MPAVVLVEEGVLGRVIEIVSITLFVGVSDDFPRLNPRVPPGGWLR